MKEFKVLKIVDKFKGIYEKLGVDYDVMRLIVQTKLVMDGRRTSVALSNTKNKDKDSNQFSKALMMYAFIGLFLMFTLIFKINIMYQLSVYFSAFMFFILTVFISDFSSVLLDVKDKNLIGTKGISLKTVSAAKLTHVFIYMMFLTLALGGFSILACTKYGIAFTIVFIIDIILIDLFMVMITSLVYFVTLKFFDGERLKDIINGVQIALSLTLAVGGQIIPRLFTVVNLDVSYAPKLWHFLFPPMWFAAPLEIIDSGSANFELIIMTVLAVIIPIVSIVVYGKLSNSFEQYLQKLSNNTYKSKDGKEKFSFKVSKILCRNKDERIFFNFVNSIMGTERTFKLKAYPSLGLALIFPFIFMGIGATEFTSISEWKDQMSNSVGYLGLYAIALMLPNILILLRFSEMYKASWIYKTMPMRNTAPIFKGMMKAVIYKFVVPIFIIQTLVFTAIFTPKVLIQVVPIFLATIFLLIIIFVTMDKVLPFTRKLEIAEVSGNIGPVILTMLLTALLAGVHFAISFTTIGIYIYSLVLLILDVVLWSSVFNVKWKSLK